MRPYTADLYIFELANHSAVCDYGFSVFSSRALGVAVQPHTDVSMNDFYRQLLKPHGAPAQRTMSDSRARSSRHLYRMPDAKACSYRLLEHDPLGRELLDCNPSAPLVRLIGRTGSGKTSRGPISVLRELLYRRPDKELSLIHI